MKILIGLLTVLLLANCSTIAPVLKCDLEDGLEGTIAYGIEMIASCTGTVAVRASVNSWVDSAGACKSVVAGRLGDSAGICSLIAGAASSEIGSLANSAINSKFPTWNCSPSNNLSMISPLLSAACLAVFPPVAK